MPDYRDALAIEDKDEGAFEKFLPPLAHRTGNVVALWPFLSIHSKRVNDFERLILVQAAPVESGEGFGLIGLLDVFYEFVPQMVRSLAIRCVAVYSSGNVYSITLRAVASMVGFSSLLLPSAPPWQVATHVSPPANIRDSRL